MKSYQFLAKKSWSTQSQTHFRRKKEAEERYIKHQNEEKKRQLLLKQEKDKFELLNQQVKTNNNLLDEKDKNEKLLRLPVSFIYETPPALPSVVSDRKVNDDDDDDDKDISSSTHTSNKNMYMHPDRKQRQRSHHHHHRHNERDEKEEERLRLLREDPLYSMKATVTAPDRFVLKHHPIHNDIHGNYKMSDENQQYIEEDKVEPATTKTTKSKEEEYHIHDTSADWMTDPDVSSFLNSLSPQERIIVIDSLAKDEQQKKKIESKRKKKKKKRSNPHHHHHHGSKRSKHKHKDL